MTVNTLAPETIRRNDSGFLLDPFHASAPDRPPLLDLNVMVDIDDVVFPWILGIHERCRAAGLHDIDQPDRWKMWEQYGVPQEAWADVVGQACLDGFYTDTDPIPGSVEALRRLYWEGARIHVVTARGFMQNASNIRGWTDEWLERTAFPWHTRTFNKDKVAAAAEALHHKSLTLLGATDLPTWDYAIDDGPHNYEALDNAGIEVYLLSAPHNQDFVAERRVGSVGEFVDTIIEREANRG